MIKCNPNNERIKREYFEWQKEANQKSEKTIDMIRRSIDRYEQFTSYEDFRRFNKNKAVSFKKHLTEFISTRTGKPLSLSTILPLLRNVKRFFNWLKLRDGYKRFDLTQFEYFNLSEKEERIAKSNKLKEYPTIEQIKMVLHNMPSDSDIDRRNRALLAFTILTGIRDGATASLKLKHIKLKNNLVVQKPDEVKTKFGKQIYTYFFPVGDDIKAIVVEWIGFLYKEKSFNENDPMFPRTKVVKDEKYEFKSKGIEPVHWSSANRIRTIFKDAFQSAGIKYFPPHSFRITLALLGEKICQTPEEFKAWSQNLGHEHPSTTFISYGHIEEHSQGEIISNLASKKDLITDSEMIKEIYEHIKTTKSD